MSEMRPLHYVLDVDVSEADLDMVDQEFIHRKPQREGIIVGGGLRNPNLPKPDRDRDMELPYVEGCREGDSPTRYPLVSVFAGDSVRLLRRGDDQWVIHSVTRSRQGLHGLNLIAHVTERDVKTFSVSGRSVVHVDYTLSVHDRVDDLDEGSQLHGDASLGSLKGFWTVVRAYDKGCVLDPRRREQIWAQSLSSSSSRDYTKEHYVPNGLLLQLKSLQKYSREEYNERLRQKSRLLQKQVEKERIREDTFAVPTRPASVRDKNASSSPIRRACLHDSFSISLSKQ